MFGCLAVALAVAVYVAVVLLFSLAADPYRGDSLLLGFMDSVRDFSWLRPTRTGPEGLIGAVAKVRGPFGGPGQEEGKVVVNGEIWKARLTAAPETALEAGDVLEVEGRDGLVLLVRPFSREEAT